MAQAARLIICYVGVGVLFALGIPVGCDRYSRSNPFDPEYRGSSGSAELRVSNFELSEQSSNGGDRQFKLNVRVVNAGSGAAPGVVATLGEEDPAIELGSVSSIELGHILAGDSASGLFGIYVLRETKTPKAFRIKMTLSSTDGHEWIDTLELTVHEAGLLTRGLGVQEIFGIEGERRFKLFPTVMNTGPGTGTGVSATITESDTDVSLPYAWDFPLYFGDILAGDTAKPQAGNSMSYWVAALSSGAQTPRQVRFFIRLSVSDGRNWDDTVNVVFP